MIEYSLFKIPEDKRIVINLEKAKYADLILNARLDKCKIVSQKYKSKYNSYVEYDEQPLTIDGFNYSVTLEFYSEDYMEFYCYDIQAKLDLINHLEGCLKLDYEGSNNK